MSNKKRTLGDEYRDFIAGKIDGGYFTGVKRNTNKYFFKDEEKSRLITANEINALRKEATINANTPQGEVHTVPSKEQYYQRLATVKNTITVPSEKQFQQYQNDANTLKQIEQYLNEQKYDTTYSGYNYEQLKAELAKTDIDTDKDLYSYLENKVNEVATSNDYQTEYDSNKKRMDEINTEKRKVIEAKESKSWLSEQQVYIDQEKELDNEWDSLYARNYELETLINKKKYEEDEAEFNNLDEETRNVIYAKNNLNYWSPTTWFDENTKKVEEDFKNLDIPEEEKNKYLEAHKRIVERKNSEQNLKAIKEQAENHPVLASALSVGNNTLGAISDSLKYVGAAFSEDGYINPDTTNVAKAQVAREVVSEDMNGVGKFLYNTGMSIVDNIARLPITALPGGKALNLAIAGTSSGVSSANEVIERGGSLKDALFTGGVSATAEIIFEKIPLEKLAKLKKEGTDSVKKAILTQIGTEAFEELGTDGVNIVADYIINQDLSQFSLQYEEYLKQGYSEAEASKRVAGDIALQLGQSVLAGGISGGTLSGGVLLLNYGGYKLQQHDLNKLMNKETREVGEAALASEDFDLNNLIAQGKVSGNAKAVKLAESIEKSIKKNNGSSKIFAVDVGNLMYLMTLDRPNNNEVENTEKQEIINENYTMGGTLKNEVANTTQQTAVNKNSEKTTDAFGKAHPKGIIVKTRTGGTLTVMGIESSAKDFGANDNNVILVTDNGGKVNADDVYSSQTHFQQLFNYAKNFDTIGARNFVKEYEAYANKAKESGKEPSVEAYAKAFEDLYSLGKMGVTYDSVKASGAYESAISILGGGIAYNATLAGNHDINATRQDEANKVQKIRVPGENNSINSRMYVEQGSEDSVVATDEQKQLLQAVAQKVGRDVVLTNRLKDGENGMYKDGKIYIRADLNDNYMLAVALHEATHDLRVNSPLEFQALCSFVTNYLVAKGENINEQLDDIKNRWKDKIETEDDALEELVCQTVMSIATNEQAINTVLNIKENKNILKKVASALKKIAQYTYDFMKGIGFEKHNKQAQAWLDDAKAIQDLAERLSSALDKNRNVTTVQSTEQQKNNTQKGAKYSIADDIVDDNGNHYGKGVLLDTNIFNKIKPRDWGKKLRDFVYNNLTNKKVIIFDESGNEYSVEFAKANERARKDGANNAHKVIDKLARKNDNISRLAVAHADEIIEVSQYENSTKEHLHQWLDENGWDIRIAYFIDKKGNIYRANLNIAKTKDGRNLLYDINKISNIGHGDVLSNAKSKRSSHINSNIAKNNVSQKNNNVKTKSAVDDIGFSEHNAKFSMAGELSKTANLSLLERAKYLEKAGKISDEVIRQETGWFRGYDKQWRYEIDDSKMKLLVDIKQMLSEATLKDKNSVEINLTDCISHPELFEAYPQLKDFIIVFNNSLKDGAVYTLGTNKIEINASLFEENHDFRSTISHEIQHAIQYIEGFANGSTVDFWKDKTNSGKVEFLKKEYDELLSSAPTKLKQQIKEYNKLVKEGKKKEAEQVASEICKSDYGLLYGKLRGREALIKELEQRNYQESPEELYFNTAGEIEARDTEHRLPLNAIGRKNVRPDIDNPDVVFREDGLKYQSRVSSKNDYENKYKDLTLLDTEEIKVYNDYGWTYQLFTAEDYMLLNEKFNEKYNLYKNRNDFVLGDGSRVVEVNNKLVLIGGSFENPIIYDVFVVNSNNETEAEIYKELLLNDTEENRSTKQRYIDICKSYEYYSEEETVRNYESTDFSYHKGQKDTGERAVLPDTFKNYGYTKQFQNRTRGSSEIGTGVYAEQLNEDVTDIRYSVDDTILDEFSIPKGKLGDSIYVQRQVYNTLAKDNFFNDIGAESRTVVNKNSHMIVEINKSGINETFSNKNFSSNSKSLKLLKLATIKKLPEIIENGIVIKDDVQNYHKENSSLKFAYIEHHIIANDSPVRVLVTIRKSPQKNKFWVHHVYIEKDTGSTSVGTSKSSITAYTTSSVNDTVSYDNGIVKSKYSVDDTIIDFNDDWLFDEDLFFEGTEEHINFEKVIKDSPADALNIIYNTASKTALTGIAQFKDVQLDYKAYTSIAHKVMKDYKINKRYNPDAEAKIANKIRKYVELIESGNYSDGADVVEKLVLECKGYITLSGDYDKTVLQEERENILGYLSGKTLLVTDYAEEFVRENYGNIAKYRRQMMGKVSVGLERNAKSMSKTMYMDDIIVFIEENYPMFITDECDSVQGFQWLDNLLNNVLQPRFFNRYADGFYESADTTAIEMAFDMTTEVIEAKAKQLVTSEKADKNKVRELTKIRKIAKNQREAMLKAKSENYKKQFQEERIVRTEQIKKMREKLQKHKQRSGKVYLSNIAKIEHLENQLDEKKMLLAIRDETIREEYIEGRTRTIYRERLGRMLDRMVKKLDGKAKNNEYIPESLKGPIIEVLGSFLADPGEYKNGKKKSLLGYFGEWKRIVEVGDRVKELKDAYSKLKTDNVKNPDYAFIDINSLSYQEGTFKILNMLSEQFKNKNIYELNADDLKALYTTMTELDESLRNAVEIILDGQRVAIKEAAEKGISETESVKFKKDVDKFNNTVFNVVASSPYELRNKFNATQLDPVRYGRFLSGYHDDYVTAKLFKELHEGDKNRIKIIQEAFLRIQAVTSKYSNKELKNLQRADVKRFNFKDIKTGKRVKVSQGMLVAIALTDRQADGHRHLVNEQYNHYTVIPDLDMMNLGLDGYGDKFHKVRFSEADLRNIITYVESNQLLKELAGAVSEVYNTILAQHINEVSMSKYGMLIATVQNYYPLHIYKDGAKYEKNFEAEFNDIRMKSRGFTQNRIFSYAPIIIDDVLKTFTQHVKSTAEYCGLLIPIENFKKVYNSSNGDVTLHEAIKEKFGTTAEHYIEKLMADLQRAPDVLDNSILQKAQGNFMEAKLLFNLGSALKQFAVYPTAYRYFGFKNVTAAATIGVAHYKKLSETYSNYTPYLWYRKEGNGTVVGELSRELGFTKKGLEIADIMGKLDQVVVGSLLYAAELHVEQTTDLQRGTEAFYKEVARQFEKCIDETQPNNMITSKPQFIRNNVMRLLSLNAFRSQNMAIANTLLDSVMEYAARRSDYKESKNDVTKEAKNEAFKKLVGSLIGATASSMLMGAFDVLTTLFLWHKWEDFQDEEGNVTFKTLSAKFLDYTLESLTGIFAWGDTIYQAVSSRIQGEHFWGLEVMSIENLNDFITKVSQGDFVAVASLVADCFGFPGENILKYARSISSYWTDLRNGRGDVITSKNSLGELNTDHFHYIIVRAKQNGETEKAEHFEDMWIDYLMDKKGKTKEQATEFIKDKLVTALATSDDDIELAAQAFANGDLETYETHLNKVVDYGFDSKDVKKAVDKVIKNIIADFKERKITEQEDIISDLKEQGFNDKGCEYVYNEMQNSTEEESEETSSVFDDTSEDKGVAYTYSDAFDALKNGDKDNYNHIKNYLIEECGKEEKDITSAMRNTSRTDPLWKEYIEAYENNDGTKMKELKNMLTNIYGSWDTAVEAMHRYQERMKEKENNN